MPITSTQGPAINNPGPMSATRRSDAILAISELQLADCWRTAAGGGGRTISNSPLIRIDMQGLDGNGRANLQAQINGVNGHSTIAHVLVDASVGDTSGSRADAQQVYAIRQIRGALGNSMGNQRTYTLTGTPT